MEAIQHKKVVSIQGSIGCGKSTIARHALWHLKDRRHFTGGIIMLNLQPINKQPIKNVKQMLELLDERIQNQMQIDMSQMMMHQEQMKDMEKRTSFIESFFNQLGGSEKLVKAGLFLSKSRKKQRKFLLCLDNIDELIGHEDFSQLIERFHKNCEHLHMILTFGSRADTLPKPIQEGKTIILPPLMPQEMISILLEQCLDKIEADDIIELLKMDKNFPHHKVYLDGEKKLNEEWRL